MKNSKATCITTSVVHISRHAIPLRKFTYSDVKNMMKFFSIFKENYGKAKSSLNVEKDHKKTNSA